MFSILPEDPKIMLVFVCLFIIFLNFTKFLVFTQFQETQKTIDIAAILVSQTKEIIKILLLRVLQHGRHDVR